MGRRRRSPSNPASKYYQEINMAKKQVKKGSGSYMGAFSGMLGAKRKGSMDDAINRMSAGKGSKKKSK